ncbi:MAG: hypothetical protein HC788_09215 [Sphingopyxis sp.]|nr:hypothetical protein [Sphingopyxis sp.]
MSLFGILSKYLPRSAAILVFALIYVAIIVTMVLLLPTPAADFRYGRY